MLATEPYILIFAFYILGVALLTHWQDPYAFNYQIRLVLLISIAEMIFATGPLIEAFFTRAFHDGVPNALLYFRLFVRTNLTLHLVSSAMYGILPAVATAVFTVNRTEKSEAIKAGASVAVLSLIVSDTILHARQNRGTVDDYLISIVSNLVGGSVAGVLIGLGSIQIRLVTFSRRRASTKSISQHLSRTLFGAGCVVLVLLITYFIFGFTPPTTITLKLDQWRSIGFEYSTVYKNDSTPVEVVPIKITTKQFFGVTSGPTLIEWSAAEQSKPTLVELELFAVSAELLTLSGSFPKLTLDSHPFYRGKLQASKLHVSGDDMAMYWIRGAKDELDVSTAVRTNVYVKIDNDWRARFTFPDGRQRLGDSNTVFTVTGKGALFNVTGPKIIEFVMLPGSSTKGFQSQTKEILDAVQSDELISFDAQAAVPKLMLRAKAVKTSDETTKNVYPMVLARLKSMGDITLTSGTPTSHFILDKPSFELNVFRVKTMLRDISIKKPEGQMQLGSQAYKLSDDLFIESGIAFTEADAGKLALKGTADVVLANNVQLIPTIAQSIGKEIWSGLIGGLIGTLGTLFAVWWPKRYR
jgi:hypothetical protein